MSNPRASGNVINWLAESWPIRNAARLTARMYLTSKNQLESKVKAQLEHNGRTEGFKRNFLDNLKKAIEEEQAKSRKKH